MPSDLTSIATYVGALVFVLVLIFIGARLLKGTTASSGNKSGSFLCGRERRLGVVEAGNVDGRRKLILIRRDDVEHLIMTGGPVDVVVETGIRYSPPAAEQPPASQSYQPERNDDHVVIAHDEPESPPSSPGYHDQDQRS